MQAQLTNILPYLIKTFRGGISDEADKGVPGAYKHGYGLDIHKRVDSLSAKQAMATIYGSGTTTQTGLIRFFVPASDGSLYCFSDQGSIFARSGDGAWNFVYSDENGPIKGAAEWELSTGVNYLFWATSTSLARKELIGADVTPDSGSARWTDATQDFRTTLSAVEWHTMHNAGGQLMIANGNQLATVDFDGNFLAGALNIRPGNQIKTLEERDDYVILGSFREDGAEEGYLWSWITTATNWIQKKRIPVKGVNALISAELMLLQGGSNGELYFSDFVNAVPLHGIPGNGQVYPGATAIEGGNALFGLFGGTYPGIWSYGRKRKNRPYALNYDYRLVGTVNGSTVSTVGAVALVDDTLFASYGTTDGSTSEYFIDSISSTTKANAIYEGLEFDSGVPFLKKIVNTIKFDMTALPSGTSVSAKFKTDRETDWRYAVLGDGTTTYSVTNAVEAEFSIGKPAMILEIGAELNSSGNTTPEIHAITTYLADTNTGYSHG